MTSKVKKPLPFLDPVGAGCKFVLLKLMDPNTKIRIVNNTVQPVPDSFWERIFYRPLYGDSREDLQAIYPVIVRFVELYLTPKKVVISNQPELLQPMIQQITPLKQEHKPKKESKKKKNDFDIFGTIDDDNTFGFNGTFGIDDDNEQEEEINEAEENNVNILDLPLPIITNNVQSIMANPRINEETEPTPEEVYKSLVKIAKYMIDGFKTLQITYKHGNVVHTLQLYINLLNDGINGTFNRESLPEHLRDLTSQNLLDENKIQNLWDDKAIMELGDLLTFCFESNNKKNRGPISSSAYRSAINAFLVERDEIFIKMISPTNC